MKYFFPLLFLPLTAMAFQQPAPKSPAGSGFTTLTCRIYAAPGNLDSLTLYEPRGLGMKVVQRTAKRQGDSLFVFKLPMAKARMYVVGMNESSVAKVILGEEKEVMFYANAQFINKARTTGSVANKALENLQKQITQLENDCDQAFASYNAIQNPDGKKPLLEKLKSLSARKTKVLDSLKLVNPILWRVATLNLTPVYTMQEGFANQAEFIGANYFSYANVSGDRGYDDIPDVTLAFENFFHALTVTGATQEQMKQFSEAQLAKIPATSNTYRMALSGLINGAHTANSYLYPTWVKLYMDAYRTKSYGEINRLDYELKKAGTFMIGLEAPDLGGMTPDSQYFALSNLRGKIVLVDFWASWCGPCRRENPNVKMNYSKYHGKGFDVLGVSLDREMNAWKGAIQQDGLEWHHISDLKGWQSAFAQLYSITSIPQTILIDKEGRILGRNLRGEQLNDQLKQIFGD
jgi:thiol-disulfide isomerase/thioredoxin